MKNLKTAILLVAVSLSMLFIAAPSEANAQVVPKGKHYSKKIYRGGRKVTVVTYKHGKRITKKVYGKSKSITKKSYSKTKHFIMGPSKKNQ